MLSVKAEPLTDDGSQPNAAQFVTVTVGQDAAKQIRCSIHAVPLPANGLKPLTYRVIVLGEVGAQPVLDTTVKAEDVGILNTTGNGVKTSLVERAPRVVNRFLPLRFRFATKFVDIGNNIVADKLSATYCFISRTGMSKSCLRCS